MKRFEKKRWFRRDFWQIEREGVELALVQGRVGKPGKASRMSYVSEREALHAYETWVRQQVEADWVLVESVDTDPSMGPLEEAVLLSGIEDDDWEYAESPPYGAREPASDALFESPLGPLARNLGLELEIVEADEDANWRVYADWLQTQGDELGLYIHQCMEGSPDPKLAARMRATWLGEPFARDLCQLADSCFRIQWKRGFVHRARVSADWEQRRDMLELLGTLLDSPASRFLRGLQLGLTTTDGENGYAHTVPVFTARAPLRSVEHLFVGNFLSPDDCEISWTAVGDISAIPACFPRLRDYRIRGGQIELGSLRHQTIERLVIESGGLNRSAVLSIMNAELPALRELELWLGDPDYGCDVTLDAFEPLLAGRFSGLTTLRLRNANFTNDLVGALAESEVLTRLRVLDLSMGTLHGPGVQALLANSERFAHLEQLDLHDNYLSEAEGEAVRTALQMASVAGQKQISHNLEGQARYYVSVGE